MYNTVYLGGVHVVKVHAQDNSYAIFKLINNS